jgi:hypothetical protein
MLYELDGDPQSNTRGGTNPHSNPTSPPSERGYTSQPLDPPRRNGGGAGPGAGIGGQGMGGPGLGGGGLIDPFPDDPLNEDDV